MVCQVIRNKKNEIETILAPNGKDSILYKDLLKITNIKEDAFKLWTKVYTPAFKSWFGDWLDNPQSVKNLDDNGEPKLQGTYYVNSNGETQSVVTNQDTIKPNEVAYMLKAVNILQSDKAQEVFNKGEKNNWSLDKILSELQIPKEQKDLILSSGKTSREDILLDLASNYSFAVEVNTAKENNMSLEDFNNPNKPKIFNDRPTQHYSNMTVNEEFYKNNPDWEYKEQRITTPLITPSIKGHAQFAQDNDIGWFRAWYNKKTGEVHVLEVQSDLFQKGRDKSNLTNKEASPEDWIIEEDFGFFNVVDGKTGQPINSFNNKEKAQEFLNQYKGDNKNQFLQLLNKDNNWVTFFIKSIIQDSAKKGYEKVLFPSGDTASKVEGHTTLEEFKKQKEDRIKELENKLKEISTDEFFNKTYKIVDNQIHKKESTKEYPNLAFTTKVYSEKEAKEVAYEFMSKSSKQEIAQLKQELERVEGPEGFGALKPIYNFYENTVTNILKKQFGAQLITTTKFLSDVFTPNGFQIVFGHPTIGKTFLKNNKDKSFITLDDDYADEINSFVDSNKGSETRQEYKGRKPKEYNDFMNNLFNKVKKIAKDQNKPLLISNTNVLKSNAEQFDIIINIPKDEFKKRFEARGATYGFEDWKSDIDNVISNIKTFNKVTDEYGNTWNEVVITEDSKRTILMNKTENPVYENIDIIFDEITEEIFDNNLSDTKYSVVIEKLIAYGYIEEELIPIARALKTKDCDIIFTDDYSEISDLAQEKAYMLYDFNRESGRIILALDRIGSRDKSTFGTSIIHEMMHHYTSKAFHFPETEREREFSKNIERLYNVFKKRIGSQSYGFMDAEEFISEIISNTEFQRELTEMNLFDKFLNFLYKLFGKEYIGRNETLAREKL